MMAYFNTKNGQNVVSNEKNYDVSSEFSINLYSGTNNTYAFFVPDNMNISLTIPAGQARNLLKMGNHTFTTTETQTGGTIVGTQYVNNNILNVTIGYQTVGSGNIPITYTVRVWGTT